MYRPTLLTGGCGLALMVVGIVLSVVGSASVTLFAIGLAAVGGGTVALAALLFYAIGEVRDVRPADALNPTPTTLIAMTLSPEPEPEQEPQVAVFSGGGVG